MSLKIHIISVTTLRCRDTIMKKDFQIRKKNLPLSLAIINKYMSVPTCLIKKRQGYVFTNQKQVITNLIIELKFVINDQSTRLSIQNSMIDK